MDGRYAIGVNVDLALRRWEDSGAIKSPERRKTLASGKNVHARGCDVDQPFFLEGLEQFYVQAKSPKPMLEAGLGRQQASYPGRPHPVGGWAGP